MESKRIHCTDFHFPGDNSVLGSVAAMGRRCSKSHLLRCAIALALGFVAVMAERNLNMKMTVSGKSTGDVLREKIADLYVLRNSLQRTNKPPQVLSLPKPVLDNNGRDYSNHTAPLSRTTVGDMVLNMATEDLDLKLENRILPFSSVWSGMKSLIAMKNYGGGILSRMLPNTQFLRRVMKIRNEMDPGLRDYLMDKYNGMISNLAPFSEKIGVPSSVLDRLKLQNGNHDMQWFYVDKLLESSTMEDLIRKLPSLVPAVSPYVAIDSNSIQSRTDEELVSDQEPDATVNGHKKKYTSYGIRLGTRRIRPTKGDEDIGTASLAGPDRTGYEYSSYADQYGLYGHDSYDTYGKGYDEYSSGKGYGGGSGGHGHDSKGYESYSYHKGGSGKGTSSSYGQSTYYSPKGYGHGGGGHGHGGGYGHSGGHGHGGGGHGGGGYGHGGGGHGGGGYGHGGGGHGGGGYGHGGGGHGGGGHGGGGYGHGGGGGGGHGHGMMGGLLDPFSILGSLAFLTYLGLLFQQSTMNMNTMTMPATTGGTGGTMGGRHRSGVGGNTYPGRRSIFGDHSHSSAKEDRLLLSLNVNTQNITSGKSEVKRVRRSLLARRKSLKENYVDSSILENSWDKISELTKTTNIPCRHQQICALFKNERDASLLYFFKDALLRNHPNDKYYVENLLHRRSNGENFDCGSTSCK